MKALTSLFLISSLASNLLVAQQPNTEFPKLTSNYLGQKPPETIPEIFAPGLISTEGLEHSKISFSKKGTSCYWAAQPSGKSNRIKQRIRFSQLTGNKWSNPIELDIPQIGLATPTISPDESTLFYIGSQDRTVKKVDELIEEVFTLDLKSKKISNISDQFPALKNSWSFSFADNGDIYFDYSAGRSYEIYVMKKQDRKYSSPQKLPIEINDGKDNFHPFISRDGKFLIFASSRSGESKSADLFVSFKGKDGKWTVAQNLGGKINSENSERFPSLSYDGKYLFFIRREGGENEFYWVSAKIIEELKPKELK